ncbi:MAG: hypothetical protein KJ747_10070 [Actinobacteria bacterium]|nr:hypothetical protein [Actinomycetota bacterium]MCG2808276.1 hypothetical protein [Coriobacteriia bacterium]
MDIHGSRPNEFKTVEGWLDSEAKPGRVDIFGISGYGGVGKSYLLNQVLEYSQPMSRGYLKITADGQDSSILGDFMALYDRKFAPKTVPSGKPNFDYFPHARALVQQRARLTKRIEGEIEKADMPEAAKKAARLIFAAGTTVNKYSKKTKDAVDFKALQEAGAVEGLDMGIDFLGRVGVMVGTSWLPGPVKNVLGITYRERLRTDLYGLSSDEWVADLCAILNRPQRKDRYRLFESPIEGLDRLLLVIDDFEILGKTIADFVTSALIPALEHANFHSTVIILGRDALPDAHVSFQHHLSRLVRDKIRLERFPDDVARQMFREAGHPDSDIPTLMEESQGYPFLVSLLCEAKGGGVSFYQQLYERTTRWMAPMEKQWVIPLSYLDRVTKPAIEAMLPDAPASVVMEWFKHEASLRDPNAEWYVIAPYIRRMLKEYHCKEIGPKRQLEMIAKGEEASLLA